MTEVRKAKYFSVLADEVADVSNTEQMSLVLRFVDESNNIREEFVDILPCTSGTTGQVIADMILDRVREYGLNPAFIRGQGYDGGGYMSGKLRGPRPFFPFTRCGRKCGGGKRVWRIWATLLGLCRNSCRANQI